MRRPWQIWSLFVLCLAIVLPAMAWLTYQTLAADRAEWLARWHAEREETIGSVLWQMDTQLTPLLAQEAARPHFVYSSFYTAPTVLPGASKADNLEAKAKLAITPADWSARQLPSPLLTQSSPYVLLHFQMNAQGQVTSPQVPDERLAQLADEQGVAMCDQALHRERLAQLQQGLAFERVASLLPTVRLTENGVAQWQLANTSEIAAPQSDALSVGNALEYSQVKQELEVAQKEETNAANGPPAQQALLNAPTGAQNFLANSRQSRAANDLQQRNQAYQSATQRQVLEQRSNYFAAPELKYVSEGINQPIWLDGRLLLARRVNVGDNEIIQGCWLDWNSIRKELTAQFTDLLPELKLEAVTPTTDRARIKVTRLLATLPLQLVLPEVSPTARSWSPLRFALVVAWSMLAIAAGAVALLLQGVITLSERRGAFVSAVTHELRTPLTTFRIYAEMLAENMVPSAEVRQRYLETLRVEADRLSHLVENVLAYARLERGRHGRRREQVSLGPMLVHWRQRFAERAQLAEMQLVVEPTSDAVDYVVRTDPSAVEQILFNLLDNACKYAAAAQDRRIHLEVTSSDCWTVLRVRDHGPGIDAKAARRLFRPFSKSVHDAACSAPGVGLGLALSRRLAQELGGRLVHEPTPAGAVFALYLPK